MFVVFQSTQDSDNTCICSDLSIFCYTEKLLIELLWLSWNVGNGWNVFLLVQWKLKNQVGLGEKDGKKDIFSDLFLLLLLFIIINWKKGWQEHYRSVLAPSDEDKCLEEFLKRTQPN